MTANSVCLLEHSRHIISCPLLYASSFWSEGEFYDNMSEQVYGSHQPRAILPCQEKAWFMSVADTGLYRWWYIRRCTSWSHLYAMEDETTHVSTTAIVYPQSWLMWQKSWLFVAIKNAGCDYIITYNNVSSYIPTYLAVLLIMKQNG